MNPVLANPDIKINMSLDEIIYFTRGEINSQLHWRNMRGLKKKKKSPKNKNDAVGSEHSVPLMGTDTGVDIYVSNHSPLLSVENRRRIAQAVSNRALNSDLLQKTKNIIPAEYKLVKTTHGLERVLVPAVNGIRQRKKLTRPRKLNNNTEKPIQDTCYNSLPDKPPPLVTAPIYNPTKMEVDDSDDDIIILDNPESKKQLEMIDISSDLGDDILQAKKLCISAASSMPHMTTLNDRFTMLCGSFQF